jgi:hypothetical protein
MNCVVMWMDRCISSKHVIISMSEESSGSMWQICPARGMDVCLLCLYVVLSCVGLCDGLITRPEESYRAFNCV